MAINKDKIRAAAQKYLQKGQLDRAIREFERLLEADPNDVRTRLKIGDLQTRKGDQSGAIHTYAAVAQYYSEQGFFLKAVAVYKQLLKLDPTLTAFSARLAELYEQLGLVSDALAQYRLVCAAFDQMGQFDRAREVLSKMLDLDPDNAAPRIKLAELFVKGGDVNKAHDAFIAAADKLLAAGQNDAYIEVLERLGHLQPDDIDAAQKLAQGYVKKGDGRRALAKLQPCFHKNPKDVATLDLLAQAFIQIGQAPKAASVLRELIALHDDAGEVAQRDMAQKRLDQLQGVVVPSSLMPRTAAAPTETRPPPMQHQSRSFSHDVTREGMVPEPSSTGHVNAQETQRLLVEADSFARYGLRQRAVDNLRRILAAQPNLRAAQVRLVELHEAGHEVEKAADLLVGMARAAQGSNPGLAQNDLHKALRLVPTHPEAQDLLASLGGELPPAPPALPAHPDAAPQVPLSHADQARAATTLDADTMTVVGMPPETGDVVDLSSELDEIHFFVQQRLFDEAHELLQGLAAAHPGHPAVVAATGQRAAHDAPAGEIEIPAAQPVEQALQEEVADIQLDDSALEVPFEDIFERFKKGVEQQVSNVDYDTHYNLGIAYKGMGLLDDAIREFELTLRSPTLRINALMMTGLCLLQAGKTETAVAQFLEGLSSPHITPREQVALRYEVGAVYEAQDRFADARKFYEKACEMDPTFRDVGIRLRETSAREAESSAAVSDDLDMLLRDVPGAEARR